MKNIIKIILFLILLSPFLSVCESVSHAKDWANFKRYEMANTSVKARPRAILFGDSITDAWYRKDSLFFKDNNFLGRGISGQTTSEMLVRFRKDVLAHRPKYVVILAGTNDIAENNGEIALDNVFGNIVSMCELAKLHKVKPVICSVLPASEYPWRKSIKNVAQSIESLNSMLKKYAKENHFIYVDYHSTLKNEEGGFREGLASDGVHPVIDGYKIMEEILLKTLK